MRRKKWQGIYELRAEAGGSNGMKPNFFPAPERTLAQGMWPVSGKADHESGLLDTQALSLSGVRVARHILVFQKQV